MKDFDNRDTGALFKNDKRSEKAPDYTGEYTTQDGQKKRRIAAWIRESKSGKTYMSLKFSDMQAKQPMDHVEPETNNNTAGDGFDEIPFNQVDWRAS